MGKSQSKLSSNQGLKKALLIGINYIEDTSNKLEGCINDVKNIKKQTHTEKHLIHVPRGLANFLDIGSTYFNNKI